MIKEKTPMTDEKKLFGFRIGYFAKRCYGSLTAFAKTVDIAPQQLNAYVHGLRTAHAEVQLKFYNAGMSVDWLLSGTGNMFARNPKGDELREAYGKYPYPDIDSKNGSESAMINQEDLIRMVEETVLRMLDEAISSGKISVKLVSDIEIDK